MDKFSITGPCRVMKGEVSISGSKNSALPILAATLLFDKPVIIENLPMVRDIYTMLDLLKSLGSNIEFLNNKKHLKTLKKICIFLNLERCKGLQILSNLVDLEKSEKMRLLSLS